MINVNFNIKKEIEELVCLQFQKFFSNKNYDLKINILLNRLFIDTDFYFNNINKVKKQIYEDLEFFMISDPAVLSKEEVILCYPGFYAISLYRIARLFYINSYKIVARIISEYAHVKTGVDIHPGANIGSKFFIDHATEVVIGQTTIIGNNVKIYHGVTLGALVLDNNPKRHPTIKDNVTIYCNTTILGGNTVIKENCIIGSNLFITKSIEKDSKITYSYNK